MMQPLAAAALAADAVAAAAHGHGCAASWASPAAAGGPGSIHEDRPLHGTRPRGQLMQVSLAVWTAWRCLKVAPHFVTALHLPTCMCCPG